jgi:hypothetical protein
MGNINLLEDYKKTEDAKNNPQSSKRQKLISTGLTISLALLVLTFLVWGGVTLWNKNLESKITSMDVQIKGEESNLRGGDASRVLDFKQRLDEIATNFSQKRDANDIFGKVEGLVVQGVVAKSLKVDGSLLLAVFSADNFGNLSKQVFNLKKASANVSNVKVFDIKKDQGGAINFTIKSEISK